ncbi:DMT family transporter [Planococcus salinus]|uniref:DMT family transporter n=1 Tax=Planococcus salinus TaxID=1848460 RepID=UPI001F02F5C8|nr:DMT family transporter [Planococcus salinus]
MILVVVFYAGNILVGKAVNDLPPVTISFFRLLIAFIVLFPLGFRSAWQYKSTFIHYKKPFLLMTLTGIAFFNAFLYGALQFTTATNASVLEAVIPAATALMSAVVLKEQLRGIQWLGILVSLLGSVWVVMDGRIFQVAAMPWNAGDGIMVGAIICWAVYSITVKQYMHLFPSYGALLVMTGISLLVLGPLVLIEWYMTGFSIQLLAEAPGLVAGLLYLGIFPSFIALLLYNRAVGLLGASRASVFLNFLPVATMAGAYFWLGETITSMHILGALLVIAGVIMTTQVKREP